MESDLDSEKGYRLPAIPERLFQGGDELNFAEFPIASFAASSSGYFAVQDEVPDPLHPGKTVTRRFEVISSSVNDPLGPLVPDDEWVLFGLFQLSKLQGFPKQVRFTRYQLLKLLGWQTNARDYERLSNSLMRLQTFHFRFYNGFFNSKSKSFETVAFHLFNSLKISEAENSLTRPKPNPYQETFLFACSFIVWSDELHDQFLNRGVKGINFEFVKSLDRSLSRRLYRFLDKNFHYKSELTYDLETFVTAHLGLKGDQEFNEIKRTILPAITELEGFGFLRTTPAKERFVKQRRSDQEMEEALAQGRKTSRFKYKVVFQKGQFNAVATEQQDLETPRDEDRRRAVPLINRGVSEDQALKLARSYPDTIIMHAVDVADWLKNKNTPFKTSMGAFLYDRIVNHKDRQDPPGFMSRAKRAELLEAKKKKEQHEKQTRDEAAQRQSNREQTFEAKFSAWWDGLGELGRTEVDSSIMAREMNDFERRFLDDGEKTPASQTMWRACRKAVFSQRTNTQAPG